MRVALISHNARCGDAIGNQVAARAAFFRERGAELLVLVESDRELHADLVRSTSVIASSAEMTTLVAQLRHCDLIVVDYGQYYRLLEVLPALAGTGPRILFDYHGVTPPELWDGPAEALREGQKWRGLVWYADQAVVHSRFMQQELCAATGYPASRIHILPLWFRPPSPATSGTLRRKLGLTDERLLLFVGRLATNKRVPVLIEALALMQDERPRIHAAIIGDTGDTYRRELGRCRELAAERGISDRVHFLGRVGDEELADAYRSADLFVMPSLHEGCCIPVMEAMAAGVPVIAARAAALSESIAGAGVSFAPDDPADLTRQVRRVLRFEEPLPEAGRGDRTTAVKLEGESPKRLFSAPPLRFGEGVGGRGSLPRIAVIAPRYGDDVLGGAERSLRLIAETLAAAGHRVEVFTTGRGTETRSGVHVRRFPSDPVDEAVLATAQQALRQSGAISDTLLNDYFRQTRHSSALLKEYENCCHKFDACIVGPYANGLTWEAMRLRAERTLLLPCFHREPLARQPALVPVFSQAGGLLYHSAAERSFAEAELGIHHPNATVIGTWVPPGRGDPVHGWRLVGADRPYLLYAGRACREKNVPLLVKWLQRYADEHPQRFRFAFIGGEGSLKLPSGPDWKNLGLLSEADRGHVFAGAAALLQLSTNESLSLAALEAWAERVPVIAHAECDVMRDHFRRGAGGALVGDYEEFREALNDLWRNVERWSAAGRRGRDMVQREYGSRDAFAARLAETLAGLDRPLAELMSERGRQISATRTEAAWRQAFAERVDDVLDAEPLEPKAGVDIAPRKGDAIHIRRGSHRSAIRLRNSGTVPLWPEGPKVARLHCRLLDSSDQPASGTAVTRLPRVLNPGQECVLDVRLPATGGPGQFVAELTMSIGEGIIGCTRLPLFVGGSPPATSAANDPSLEELSVRLAEADALVELPSGYQDVSEGPLARWKQAIKRKLLHQFQASYVDVLSRQQTALNRLLLAAFQDLAERTAMLGQAVEQIDALERRVAALEARRRKSSKLKTEVEAPHLID